MSSRSLRQAAGVRTAARDTSARGTKGRDGHGRLDALLTQDLVIRDGLGLRDVRIAARHADPRTTMRYDRARKNLDRHPNYILAAYMAAGT